MQRSAMILCAVFLLTACKRPAAPKPPERPAHTDGVVDVHTHIGLSEYDRLIGLMDQNQLAWVLNLSGTWPGAILESHLEKARETGRVLVACNLPWMAVRHPQFPQIGAQIVEACKAAGARALKIEKHLGLAAKKADGTLLAVDDPWLDPIWTAAGVAGLPVMIHTGDPKAFWLPVDENNERLEELTAHPKWSNFGEPIPSFDALLKQFINLVARHPKTKFVGVHFGNNSEDPWWVKKQLDLHPNLYVDLAARLPEIGRHDPKKLRTLFIEHQDRILFGTDTGLGRRGFVMLGSFGEEPDTEAEIKPFFDAHWRYLETADEMPSPTPIQGRWNIKGLALPRDVLRKIYRGNAERLFGVPLSPGVKTSPSAKTGPGAKTATAAPTPRPR